MNLVFLALIVYIVLMWIVPDLHQRFESKRWVVALCQGYYAIGIVVAVLAAWAYAFEHIVDGLEWIPVVIALLAGACFGIFAAKDGASTWKAIGVGLAVGFAFPLLVLLVVFAVRLVLYGGWRPQGPL